MARPEGSVRLVVGPEAVAVVLAGVAVALVAFAVAASATRVLGWAVASGVLAAVVAPLVTQLDRRMPRPLAVVLVLLGTAAAVVGLNAGVLSDLDREVDRLRRIAPQAAAVVQRSDESVGDVARSIRLRERVDEVVDRLRDPTSGLAEEAATSASGYVVSGILTAFFLSWGPRAGRGALAQLEDPALRARVEAVAHEGFGRGRRYVLFALARSAVAGALAWGICTLEGVPASIVLGVAVAALTAVPGFGILAAALPALLLEAGLGTGAGVVRLVAAFALLQVADVAVLRHVVTPRALAVGSATIVVAAVLGFEVYGVGGAVYATALAVLATAVLDAVGRRRRDAGDVTWPGATGAGSAEGSDGDADMAPAGHAAAGGVPAGDAAAVPTPVGAAADGARAGAPVADDAGGTVGSRPAQARTGAG